MKENLKETAQDLFKKGLSTEAIAIKCGVSIRTIQRWMKDVRSVQIQIPLEHPSSSATKGTTSIETIQNRGRITSDYSGLDNLWTRERLRRKEVEFLDKIQDTCLHLLDDGDFRMIDRLIKISERRSKLLGLEARPLDILDAVELLVTEGVATEKQASTIYECIKELRSRLISLNSITDAMH